MASRRGRRVYLILPSTANIPYVPRGFGAGGRRMRKNGHGGNKLLKDLVAKDSAYPDAFTYSVLQVLHKPSRKEVVQREQCYKQKLGTLATGLNLPKSYS